MPATIPARATSRFPARRLTWRLLRDPPLAGARNMAIDHALAECLAPGEGIVRLYAWERPTLSLGRNEPSAPYASSVHELVRRPTGGRAVLHDRELTYAVVAPLATWGGPRGAYRRLNEALGHALGALGAPVELSTGGRARPPHAGPCFQDPAPGEVVARGRKLVGSAQARIGGALLQHGSILLDGDQRELGRPDGSAAPAEGSVSLRELVGDVSIDEVATAVAMSLHAACDGDWMADRLRPTERDTADRLEADRYTRHSWTWRV